MARASDRASDLLVDPGAPAEPAVDAPTGRASTRPSWTTVLSPAAVGVLAAVRSRDLAPLVVVAVALVLAGGGAVLAARGVTVVPGRATRLQGGSHLVLPAASLFLAVHP